MPKVLISVVPIAYPDGRRIDHAEATWGGRVFAAQGQTNALIELARLLVDAGAPEATRWNAVYPGGRVTSGRSLHVLAGMSKAPDARSELQRLALEAAAALVARHSHVENQVGELA